MYTSGYSRRIARCGRRVRKQKYRGTYERMEKGREREVEEEERVWYVSLEEEERVGYVRFG